MKIQPKPEAKINTGLSMVVPIRGVGKERTGKRKGQNHFYTPEQTRAAMTWIHKYAEKFLTGKIEKGKPVVAEYWFFMIPPKSWPPSKILDAIAGKLFPINLGRPKDPDLDNLEKTVSDAIEKVAFHNDCQIVDSHTFKRYGEQDEIIVNVQEKTI